MQSCKQGFSNKNKNISKLQKTCVSATQGTGKLKCLDMWLAQESHQVMSELNIVHITGYNNVSPIEKKNRNLILFLSLGISIIVANAILLFC